ncbi:MAG: DUF4384 domain-containing protein, partial [Deltaproteobacteria bacterium]|nr:DUF4384 domain-containing protein [Deltaproteobacteria bacterium]
MHPTLKTVITLLIAACILSGCSTVTTTQIDNRPVQPQPAYEDLKTVSAVEDVNFGSQDIVGMTDMMMNDILTDPFWRSGAAPGTDVPSPRIIIDDACFTNESNAEINVKMITDRLGVELNRAATGRLTFLAREFAEMVEKERTLKRMGVVSHGTVTGAARPLGADFRLCGNITTLDKTAGDMMSRFTQVAMKMIDLESGVVSWSGLYGFKKVGRKPEDLAVQKAGELRIQAWTDKQFYRVGEKLTVSFKANRDCYLFLYHQGADGAHQLIFPNQF